MDASRLASAFARAVPRYTSYPTAAQFGAAVDGAIFAAWLARVPASAPVSLYLHVPYCRALCWYCACHARVATGAETLARYRDALVAEIGAVGRAIGRRPKATRVHWGGGTPTTFEAEDFARVHDALAAHFDVTADAEIAVEIDPRGFRAPMAAALRALGVTRASFGVQDFDADVQAAINRVQPFETTRRAVDALRAAGIGSINLDLIYGLPRQTEAGLARTVERTLDLAPERIALFGYAHVPWMKRHQALIRVEELPGPEARWRQSRLAESLLAQAGYVPIGIDHFARPEDALARAAREGRLRRNFQGYTDDGAEHLIGFGASAISMVPEGYAQNQADVSSWLAAVEAGRLATARGVAVTDADRARRAIIERLMCDLRVDLGALGARADAEDALGELEALGVLARVGTVIEVRPEARPLARLAAAAFDAHLARAAARHSAAV